MARSVMQCVAVVRDVLTTFAYVYPSRTKDRDYAITDMRRFVDCEPNARIYSDNADELIVAARYLHAPHEASQHRTTPPPNGIVE